MDEEPYCQKKKKLEMNPPQGSELVSHGRGCDVQSIQLTVNLVPALAASVILPTSQWNVKYQIHATLYSKGDGNNIHPRNLWKGKSKGPAVGPQQNQRQTNEETNCQKKKKLKKKSS